MWVGLGWRAMACGLSAATLCLVVGCSAHKAEVDAAAAPEELVAQRERSDALEASLQARSDELASVQAELEKARAREQELSAALKRALRAKLGVPAAETAHHAPETVDASSAQLTSLRDELAHERQRCRALEEELARSGEDTHPDVAPVAAPDTATSCPGSAATESLRRELEREREARRKLLSEVRSLEESGRGSGGSSLAAENRALRARLIELETRQQDVVGSMARSLKAERAQDDSENTACAPAVAALAPSSVREEIVAPTEATLGKAPEVGGDEEELKRLRGQLDEERRQNARLNAKLKVAGRVAELIFKMQKQAGGQPGGEMPLIPPATEPGETLE